MSDEIKITYPIAMTRKGAIYGTPNYIYNKPGYNLPKYLPFDKLGKTTIYDPSEDGKSIVETNVTCYNFYVNSISSTSIEGEIETGSGTQEDPWINLNTVINSSYINCLCNSLCFQYVKIIITGTINYHIGHYDYYDYFDFNKRLILDFDDVIIEQFDFYYYGTLFNDIVGIRFHNLEYKASYTEEIISHEITIFSGCDRSIFYNIVGEIKVDEPYGSMYSAYGESYYYFWNIEDCTSILNCNININISSGMHSVMTSIIIEHNYDDPSIIVIGSTFYTKSVKTNGYWFYTWYARAYGIYSFYGSTSKNNIILSNTKITCDAFCASPSTSQSLYLGYVACPLGFDAVVYNCDLSDSIMDSGPNNNNWTCYN